jgi:GNAT superfamily N-acetyltransferase
MRTASVTAPAFLNGTIRTLQRSELPLLKDHLLRLDPESRHDRVNGVADERFVVRYADKCLTDDTVVIAYLENGKVRAAAELHPFGSADDDLPEVAFSVERPYRRNGLGSALFTKLIEEARRRGFQGLRITTGSDNDAMRALARKFGAKLTFRQGESSGTIDLAPREDVPPAKPAPVVAEVAAANVPDWSVPFDLAATAVRMQRRYWNSVMRLYGLGRAA